MLLAAAHLSAAPFPAAVTEAAMDFAACRVLHEDGAEPVEVAAIRELLGLGQGNAPAPTKRASSSRKPTASLQYLLVFKQPVALGTVLGGVGELRVLKAGAAFPPEPASAADWTSIEVQPSQSAPRFAPLPPGTQTRALLVSVSVPRDSRQSPFLRLLAPRLANHTPAAVANAQSEHTATSQFSPPYTHDAGHVTRGHGEWVNSGKDNSGINSRPPITELDPAWFVVSWPDARRVDGVLLQDNFNAFELQAFTGPTGINAAAATEQEWKTIRKFKPSQDGPRRWLTFDPVQTRALRLVITKTSDGPIARLAGFSVFTELGEQPAPAIVKPISTEAPVQISYDLPQAGKVTLVLDRADGTRVRNLIANTPQSAGKNSVAWDLKDEHGTYVPPGDYQWKAITHPGLSLRYEMTAYPNVSSYFPERAAWLTGASGSGGWLADHTPPRAACAWGDRVFLGAPVAESGVSLIECDLEGRKHWGHPSFEAFTGSWMLATDGKTVFNMAHADNFAKAGMDKKTEAIWAVDIETKKVRTVAMLQPTAERKRGLQGFAAHENQIFLAIHATDNWLNNAAGAADVDLANCLPAYPTPRKPRAANEVVPDPRTDTLRLFRLKDTPPGQHPGNGLLWLETTKNPDRQQHIVLAFSKPVSIGSLVFPPPPTEDKVQFQISVLKPGAPYPPRPNERADWQAVPLTDKSAWAVVALPAGTSTRALRMTFTKGGAGAADDLLADVEEKKGAPSLDAIESNAKKGKGGFAGADDDLWMRRVEGMKLLNRRFENLFPTATVRVSSGKVAPDGTWDAQRTEPLSVADPAIYALEWKQPQSMRGLALKEIDGAVTEVDVFTGPAGAPVDIASSTGWEQVGTYHQQLRNYYQPDATHSSYSRYVDGYVDFGREVSTRAVRLRVVKQWDTKAHYPSGVRQDQGGQTLDLKRCRVYGVAPLKYLGGEPAVNSLVTERLEVLDAATGKIVKEVPLPKAGSPTGGAAPGNTLAANARGDLFAISAGKLVKVDLAAGQHQVLASDLTNPTALACDTAGNCFVFDAAADRKNIRVYDRTGKFLRTIGEPGGYQRGPWNQQRMSHISALAVDGRGQVWAVDWNYWPKRVSLWSADGKFLKEFLGPTEYGGGGQLDPGDKRRLFYGPLEFELDWASGKSRLKNLLSLEGHAVSDSPIRVGQHLYLVNTRPGGHGPSQNCGVVFLHEGDRARLVAAVGIAGYFKPILEPRLVKAFGGKVLMDYLCAWSDLNGDEQVQPEEVQLWPKPKQARVVFDSQLGVQMGTVGFRVKTTRPDGVPIYERADLPGLWEGVALRLNDGNFYHFEDGDSKQLCAVQRPDGKVLWTYQTEGAGVQAITRAKPWHPAQIVCQFGFAGHATAHAGDLGEFLVFNSNVGVWDIMTADGLFAGQIFRDLRDPKALPWSGTNNTRGMKMDDITAGQEHFQGYFTRTADNKYYAVAGHNHASVVEVAGLDRFKRFAGKLAIGGKELAATQAWERNREARVLYARAPVLDAYRMSAPKLDGKLNDWPPASAELDRDAQFRIGYDDQNLYLAYEINRRGPLKNQGQQWDRLFKTGASVDLQIAADPAANPDRKAPAPGDQRLLLTLMGSQPAAVLYQAVVPGTPPDKAWQVVSPVHSVTFDRVTKLDTVRLVVDDDPNRYTLEAAVPLAVLGLKITPGLRLKLDWGILVSGPDGTEVLRREYWANKATQIIADAPSEAELHPELWGHVRFHPERTAALDPTAKKKDKSVEDLLNDLK
ncbi:MAG: hypothetical protein B9S33_07390 [Pedosphaera sp. Tous-C6FEB]|nr:MAG: hypothetical protein B9S33_07390 [Pedosphaera sp. Tous-C6FEB]